MHCRIKHIVRVLPLLAVLASCTQWFDPEINPPANVLAFEGLITNGPGPHYVKISRSAAYGSQAVFEPVSDASVSVRNQYRELIVFAEALPGTYYAPDGFSGVAGDTYTLYVDLPDGSSYRSGEQTLVDGLAANSVEAIFDGVEMPVENHLGQVNFQEVEGVKFFTDIENYRPEVPKVRFETQLYVQYILEELDTNMIPPVVPNDPMLMYCHRKLPLDRRVNVAIPPLEAGAGSSLRHELSFMPATIRFVASMAVWQLRRIDRRAVIIRQFTLNDESYAFYRSLHDQMAAEGRIFDPVAAQLQGNMVRTDKPGALVLGHFEASYYHSATYLLNPEPITRQRLSIRPYENLDHLPVESVCYLEMRPPGWIFF